MRFADLDAVTIDAHGTLLRLRDPHVALDRALRSRGVERSADAIAGAFAQEAAYYTPRSLTGRDEASLAELQTQCAAVFLSFLDARLDAAAFAPEYVAALQFEPLPGVHEALAELTARGLPLAVVANWDCSLPAHLSSLGLARFFHVVVTSAEARAAKPDPKIFALALRRLGVPPERALHIGDQPADEEGARAAGMRFRAAPLRDAVAAIA